MAEQVVKLPSISFAALSAQAKTDTDSGASEGGFGQVQLPDAVTGASVLKK